MRRPCSRRLPNNQKGFTLIELMVALVLLVVLLGIGVPSFRAMREGAAISAVSNDLVTALSFARNDSIDKGANVTVCSSNDQVNCSGGWGNGWIAIRAGTGVVKTWPAPVGGIGIVLNDQAGLNVAAPNTVVFAPLGNATAGRCFGVTMNAVQRFVGVNAGGRIASSQVACPP